MSSSFLDDDLGFPAALSGPAADPEPSGVVATREEGDIRCVHATTGRTRTRCDEWALPGYDHCVQHLPRETLDLHALADETRTSVGVKLLRLSPEAMATLESVMHDESAPAGVRAKAATEILDRAGFRGGVDIHISGEVEVNASDIVAERLAKLAAATTVPALAADALTVLSEITADEEPEPEDAEIVEPETEAEDDA